MILLRELLSDMHHEKKNGMLHVEEWKLPEVEYLHNVGFDFLDDYKMGIDKSPYLTIYKNENETEEKGKPKVFFTVEEKGKSNKTFKEFGDVISYFDTFPQHEIDKRK